MPRFTLRDLFLMTTFVAVGMACLVVGFRGGSAGSIETGGMLILMYLGSTFIGAGFGAPLHRKAIGAFVGVVLGVIGGIVVFAMLAIAVSR